MRKGVLMDTPTNIAALQSRSVSLATVRPDGWPQATTVGYVNEDLALYFLCSKDSQKAANLTRDSRVSLTIDHDVSLLLHVCSGHENIAEP